MSRRPAPVPARRAAPAAAPAPGPLPGSPPAPALLPAGGWWLRLAMSLPQKAALKPGAAAAAGTGPGSGAAAAAAAAGPPPPSAPPHPAPAPHPNIRALPPQPPQQYPLPRAGGLGGGDSPFPTAGGARGRGGEGPRSPLRLGGLCAARGVAVGGSPRLCVCVGRVPLTQTGGCTCRRGEGVPYPLPAPRAALGLRCLPLGQAGGPQALSVPPPCPRGQR